MAQGRSRSLMFIPQESSSAMFVTIVTAYVCLWDLYLCNCFHVRRANSGKITTC